FRSAAKDGRASASINPAPGHRERFEVGCPRAGMPTAAARRCGDDRDCHLDCTHCPWESGWGCDSMRGIATAERFGRRRTGPSQQMVPERRTYSIQYDSLALHPMYGGKKTER